MTCGKISFISLFCLAFFAFSVPAAAQKSSYPTLKKTGDVALGKDKSAMCAACHGAQGISAMPNTPSLAGQNKKYLINQLQAFKKGKDGGRYNALMSSTAASLSDADIDNLAAYYASLKPNIGEAHPNHVEKGQALYRGGDKSRGIPACTACHGPRGRGLAVVGYPAVSGQRADYTVMQLEQFSRGDRQGADSAVMAQIAKKMSPEDMKAVASYMEGLH